MKKPEVTRNWRLMAPIVVAVICVTAMAVSMCGKEEGDAGAAAATTLATGQEDRPDIPLVDVQWMPKTFIENRIVGKIRKEAEDLQEWLTDLARKTEEPGEEYKKTWKTKFSDTHLKNARFWKQGTGWKETWDESLTPIWDSIKGSTGISIDSISAIIEYKERADAKEAKDDQDLNIKVTITFSASPGDLLLESTLKHSRTCDWL